MRRLIGTMAIVAALLGGMPSVAQSSPSPPAEQTAPAANRLELICRNVESASSRLGSTQECHIKDEWDGQSARPGETGAPSTAGR